MSLENERTFHERHPPRFVAQSVVKQIRLGQVRMYEDKKYHHNEIHYFQTQAVTIYNPQLAPLHIDGDPAATAEKFEIRIIEKAFRLLMR